MPGFCEGVGAGEEEEEAASGEGDLEEVPAFEEVAADDPEDEDFEEVSEEEASEEVREVPEDEPLIRFDEASGYFPTGMALFLESRTDVRTAAATITATRTDDAMMINVRFSNSFFIIFYPLKC